LIAHEAAIHAAQLRVELTQSRAEQKEYLKNVELARVLDKRAKRKGKESYEDVEERRLVKQKRIENVQAHNTTTSDNLDSSVLGNIF
jgi:ribose 1,5-bisphosphokinase PhnN